MKKDKKRKDRKLRAKKLAASDAVLIFLLFLTFWFLGKTTFAKKRGKKQLSGKLDKMAKISFDHFCAARKKIRSRLPDFGREVFFAVATNPKRILFVENSAFDSGILQHRRFLFKMPEEVFKLRPEVQTQSWKRLSSGETAYPGIIREWALFTIHCLTRLLVKINIVLKSLKSSCLQSKQEYR